MSRVYIIGLVLLSLVVTACKSPEPGPDKTLTGAVLGAGWGAGTGAIIGNQIGHSGSGVAVGAGVGAVGGAISGYAYDQAEDAQIQQERELAALKVRNMANARELQLLQSKLDNAITADMGGSVYQVFFDPDVSSLRAGAVANLELIADSIKGSPHAFMVNIVGHTDDSGTPDYNRRLAEARARTVAAYLAARGLASDRLDISHFGSERPIASNNTDVGRQLNRRVDIYVSKR